jgi:MraZ protein
MGGFSKKWSRKMFLGTYNVKVDNKGRVLLPAKSRELLNDNTYLVQSKNHSLVLLNYSQFVIYKNALKKERDKSISEADFNRIFFSNVHNQKLDKQGRILIPQNMKNFAKLKNDITLIGLEESIELWNPEEWSKYESRFKNIVF